MLATTLHALGALLLVPALVTAQRPPLSAAVKQYVAVDTPVVALTHLRLIDGTGAAPKEDQTLIIRDGNIALLGAARSTRVPEGAQVLDLTGKSVIPGLVMMHEHLYYPTGPGVYGADYVSFSRLYLAGGVTSKRTGADSRSRAISVRSPTAKPPISASTTWSTASSSPRTSFRGNSRTCVRRQPVGCPRSSVSMPNRRSSLPSCST